MEKRKTVVKVAGKDYTIASIDPPEHVQRVGVYVDRKMQEIEAASHLPTNMVAILTALNIADELLKSHDENTRLRRELMVSRQELKKVTKK